MMVDSDLAEQRALKSAADVSDDDRLRSPGSAGQDGGYLAERLLAEGAEVHGLVRSVEDVGACPGAMPGCHPARRRPDRGRRASAGWSPRSRPDEIYNLAGISSVAQSWAEPVATGRVSGRGRGRHCCRRPGSSARPAGRPVRVVQASSAEIFGNPAVSPQDESTPIAPVTPYGAAKAYAHHMVRVYRGRGLHAVSAILYNHESPRRPTTFVTRKITQGAARIARGEQTELRMGNLDARRDWGWAPDYVDAMIRAARHDTATTTWWRPANRIRCGSSSRPPSRRAGIDDWETVRHRRSGLRPAGRCGRADR